MTAGVMREIFFWFTHLLLWIQLYVLYYGVAYALCCMTARCRTIIVQHIVIFLCSSIFCHILIEFDKAIRPPTRAVMQIKTVRSWRSMSGTKIEIKSHELEHLASAVCVMTHQSARMITYKLCIYSLYVYNWDQIDCADWSKCFWFLCFGVSHHWYRSQIYASRRHGVSSCCCVVGGFSSTEDSDHQYDTYFRLCGPVPRIGPYDNVAMR